MKDTIIEEIKRRARLDHGGDFTKAATEYFHDYPEDLQRYREEATGVKKRADEDRERVNAEVHYRIEYIAYREKLDLDKPVDRMAAQQKAFAEDPGLYERYSQTPCVLARFR
jgi:hypothetical protein